MLIVLEVEQIIGFSADSDFGLFWNFNNGVMGRSLDYGQGQISIDKACLELIRAHFNYHFLNILTVTW